MPLALTDENHLFGDVVGVNRRLRNHQEQNLGAFQGVYDLLTPLRGRIDPTLIDPQRHSRGTKFRGQLKDPARVIPRITYEDVGLCRHGASLGLRLN
jgi:hypothetical protein